MEKDGRGRWGKLITSRDLLIKSLHWDWGGYASIEGGGRKI